jgi:membrane-bound lytic murein transglycosylase B
LSTNEKKELQEFLLHNGFNIGKVDGMIGPKTIEAIRSLQSKLGKIPDGFATKDFLKGLK